jgi:hypothetical protein
MNAEESQPKERGSVSRSTEVAINALPCLQRILAADLRRVTESSSVSSGGSTTRAMSIRDF